MAPVSPTTSRLVVEDVLSVVKRADHVVFVFLVSGWATLILILSQDDTNKPEFFSGEV
jgi:hypothetical protein